MAEDERTSGEAGKRVAFEMSSGPGHVVLKLSDGAVLHVHPIVVDVVSTGAENEKGEPVYSVTAGMAVRLMVPPTAAKEGADKEGET